MLLWLHAAFIHDQRDTKIIKID